MGGGDVDDDRIFKTTTATGNKKKLFFLVSFSFHHRFFLPPPQEKKFCSSIDSSLRDDVIDVEGCIIAREKRKVGGRLSNRTVRLPNTFTQLDSSEHDIIRAEVRNARISR